MLSKMLLVVAMGGIVANGPQIPLLGKDKRGIQPEVGDLSGYYICRGEEANGKKYSGVAVISKKGDVYVVQWVVGAGSTFTGVGIRTGNTLSASWAMNTEKGIVRGVNMYRVEPGPRLIGRWATLPGNGMTQTETLTFLKPLDPEDD